MEKLEELVWLRTPPTKYNMPLVLDHYNILASKINEIITEKETEDADSIELVDAISQMDYILIPKKSTAEINAMVGMVSGTMVYDTTLNVMKHYNGTEWKTVSTT